MFQQDGLDLYWPCHPSAAAYATAAASAALVSYYSTQGLEDVAGVPMPEVDEQLGPLQQEVRQCSSQHLHLRLLQHHGSTVPARSGSNFNLSSRARTCFMHTKTLFAVVSFVRLLENPTVVSHCCLPLLLLQVEAVLQRLAGTSGLRKTVPALMSSALEQQLQALRPPPEDTAEATGGHAAARLKAQQYALVRAPFSAWRCCG
jgi:hypothetical protein